MKWVSVVALLDHFAPPLSITHPWRGFHSAWAAAIARLLNDGVLPPRYYTIPNVDFGGSVEIDIATPREDAAEQSLLAESSVLWNAPAATVAVPVEYPALDLVEIQVLRDTGGLRLMAAIELASPSSRARPASRRTFAVKCAGYLNEGLAVMVVDVVTERRANLHADLVRLLDLDTRADWQSPTNLYAVAYRPVAAEETGELQMWREALTVGLPLPCLPLWLGVDFSVPVDLEKSYLATCRDLRIRLAG